MTGVRRILNNAADRAPYDVADAVLHERIPTEWRVGLWLACAIIMAAAAVVYLVAGWDEDVTDVLAREEEP